MSDEQIDPELKSTLEWAKKTSEIKTPAGLETRILARLEAEQRHRSRRPWLWGLSGGFVTAMVATFILFGLRETPRERLETITRFDTAEKESVPAVTRGVPMAALKQAPANAAGEMALADKIDAAPMALKTKESVSYMAAPATARGAEAANEWRARSKYDEYAAVGHVIRKKSEWQNSWGKIPVVNFSKEMLLVFLEGKHRSHKIENGKLVVRYVTLEIPAQNHPTDWLAVPMFNGPVEFLLADNGE